MPKINDQRAKNRGGLKIVAVKTEVITPDQTIYNVLDKYLPKNDSNIKIVILASKIIAICTPNLRIKITDVKVSPLARFVTKFIKRYHPVDPGFKVPEKVQVALNIVGLPRFLFALFGGAIMKFLFRKPGYFYKIAGNNIGKIDGFIPELYPDGLKDYGFLVPSTEEANKICMELEGKYGYGFVITDSNDFDDHLIGYSEKINATFTRDQLMELISGNPHEQDNLTPIVLVKTL